MPHLTDERIDQIGHNTWWQQKQDGKIFVVIRFWGFILAERVEILPLYAKESKEVEIEKFLKLIKENKIKNITKQ